MKTWKVPAKISSIVIVGLLSHCAFLQSECYLKATQVNVQHRIIQEHLLYKFELGYHATEVTKNIYCVKGEGAVHYSTITR